NTVQHAALAYRVDAPAFSVEPQVPIRDPLHGSVGTGSPLPAEGIAGAAVRYDQLIDVGVGGAVVRLDELAHHRERPLGVGVGFVRDREVVLLIQVVLLDVRQEVNGPGRPARGATALAVGHAAGRKAAVGVVVVVQGEADLLEVVLTAHA